jgi:membrane protein implicated in regulation of membrane protease activity
MNTFFTAWVLLAFLFLFFEMGNPGLFYFLSFSFGALAAALSSLATSAIALQIIVFLAGTCLAIVVLKWWVARKSSKYHGHEKSNIYALKGKRALVLKTITPDEPGTVKVGSESWMARSAHTIAAGNYVTIVDVRGAHLVVEEVL